MTQKLRQWIRNYAVVHNSLSLEHITILEVALLRPEFYIYLIQLLLLLLLNRRIIGENYARRVIRSVTIKSIYFCVLQSPTDNSVGRLTKHSTVDEVSD